MTAIFLKSRIEVNVQISPADIVFGHVVSGSAKGERQTLVKQIDSTKFHGDARQPPSVRGDGLAQTYMQVAVVRPKIPKLIRVRHVIQIVPVPPDVTARYACAKPSALPGERCRGFPAWRKARTGESRLTEIAHRRRPWAQGAEPFVNIGQRDRWHPVAEYARRATAEVKVYAGHA